MKRFIDDLKKYYSYAKYSAKAELKAEVPDLILIGSGGFWNRYA